MDTSIWAWLDPFGLIFLVGILIPNLIYAFRRPEGFESGWHCRPLEIMEQAGRIGCTAFMVLHFPGTGWGFASQGAFVTYLIGNAALVGAYCLVWAVCFRRPSKFRAWALSVLPSAAFLLSGILEHHLLLTLSALIFAPCHIFLSVILKHSCCC